MPALDDASATSDRPISSDEAPAGSRRRRREAKQRLHEAQKKARAIDKTNDRRNRGRDKQDKKNKDKKEKKRK
ncbi:MAG: hypothetical protein ACLGI5_02345 [Thermoleophilia bacterium]